MSRFVVAAGLPAVFFLFLPLVVYATNLNSVDISKRVIVESGLLFTAIAIPILGLLFCVPRIGARLSTVASAMLIALFVIVLVPNQTGEAGGFDNDLSGAGNVIPTVKLIVLVVAGLIWGFRRQEEFRKFAMLVASIALVCSGVIPLLLTSQADSARMSGRNQDSHLLALGTKTNAVVLVLDAFTGYRMVEILNERPEIRKRLNGFTHYSRAISSAFNTPAGSSAILTGSLDSAIEIDDWTERNNVSLGRSFLAEAARNGIETSYISSLRVTDGSIRFEDEQRFFPHSEPSFGNRVRFYCGFIGVAANRVLPEASARIVSREAMRVWNRTTRDGLSDVEAFNSLTVEGNRSSIAGKMAFDRFLNALNQGETDSRVVFLFSKLSHSPWNFLENGQFQEGAGWESSSLFSAWCIVALAERLKELQVFDQTLIIVTSDHGGIPLKDWSMGGAGIQGGVMPVGFNPLIMVKPVGAQDELRVSEMTVWLGDVAATVRDTFDLEASIESRYPVRSLLLPDDLERRLSLPIFDKPDQASFHGALKEWTRIDVEGGFSDFVRASSTDPDLMLSPSSVITLRSGVDNYRTQLVAEGWQPGEGKQYGAWIEINNRMAAIIEGSGVAVLTDSTGRFVVNSFQDPAKGFAFLAEIPKSASVFVAGSRIPEELLRLQFGNAAFRRQEEGIVNFVYVSSGRSDPGAVLEVSSGDPQAKLKFR